MSPEPKPPAASTESEAGFADNVTVDAVSQQGMAPPPPSPSMPQPPPHIYALQVDKEQNDRAVEIKLLSQSPPHMRAFHCAWLAFATAFFMWFSASPLLGVIQDSLQISRKDIWLSTICSDVSTVLARVAVGSACDNYGARWPMGAVLVLAAIPTGLLGTVQSATGLCIARFCIGIAGSSFVAAQYWTGKFFVKEKIGTANAIVAGWGNFGGGLAQIVMGAGLYPLVYNNSSSDPENAWRWIFIFPAVAALAVAWLIVTQSQDAPHGYHKEMKLWGTMDLTAPSMVTETMSRNAWLLAVAYATSFGVEISLNNAGSLYFADEFGLDVSNAAIAASTLGLTNLFGRAVGGILSDMAMQRNGMQGRLGLCVLTMVWQGVAILCWAYLADSLTAAVLLLAVASLGIHLTEGAIFGIVPYINPVKSGQIAGTVGLGGNVGGIIFGACFMHLSYEKTFTIMGVAALASTIVYGGVYIPGHATLWTQETSLEALNERGIKFKADSDEESPDNRSTPTSAEEQPTASAEPALPTIQEA